MTTFKHKVDMKKFIEQMSGEHEIFTEMINNALEACENKVEVNYDEENGIATFFNDGEPLTLEQLDEKVLTAYATGDEKDDDLNRGIGFIAIYEVAEKTIVETGEHKLCIRNWQEMHLQNTDQFIKGFKVTVYLNDQYKARYSLNRVRDLLDSWIIFDDKVVFFNGAKTCTYLQNPLETETYKNYWGNFDYCYDQNLFEHEFTALLKLTNVNAYRVLDFTYDLKKFVKNPIMHEFVMIFTDSKLLDTARRGLTYTGRDNLEKCIKEINHKLSKEMLNNKVLSYGRTALKLFREKLAFIRVQLELPKDIFTKAMEQFRWHLTDSDKIDNINHEIRYLNKLIGLLKITSYKHVLEELEPISIYEVYDREVISFQLSEVDDPSEFNSWFNERFGFSQHRFFYKETIGILVENGAMTGAAKLFHLLENVDYPEYSNWLKFKEDVIVDGLLENQSLILVFADQFLFFADFPAEIEFEEILDDHVVRLDSDPETVKQFALQHKAEMDIPSYQPQETEEEDFFTDEDVEEATKSVDEIDIEPAFETLEKFMPKQQARKITKQIKLRNFFTEVLVTSDGTQILCMVDESTKQRFFHVAKSKKLLDRIGKGYQMWIEVINLLLTNFAKDVERLREFIVPAISFVESKEQLGCMIKDIISISHYSIPKVFDPPMVKILKFVKIAAHEIAHLYVSAHTPNFMLVDTSIYHATVDNHESVALLREIFKRK